MQKKAKRFLSLLLSVLMVISIVPVSAFAAGDGGDITFYVMSGVDGSQADGSESKPYLSISDAIAAAEAADASSLTLILKSDINSTKSISIESQFPIKITSDAESTRSLTYTGTESIGLQAGFLHISAIGADVTFDNVNLKGSEGAYDGRVLFVGNGANVTVTNSSITNGHVNVQSTDLGGAGILVAKGGVVTLDGSTTVSGNVSIGSGAGAYVADGGRLYVKDNVAILNNESNKPGSAIFVAEQNEDPTAGLFIEGNVNISSNGRNSTESAGGIYLQSGSHAEVKGSITVADNKIANLYLETGATLDMTGATKTSNIKVATQTDDVYTPISYAQGYTIEPTVDGDEAGWSSESSDLDIRYMVIDGREGLYLVHKTVDMIFSDIDTLESITFDYVNGEKVDATTEVVPGTIQTEVEEDKADGHRAGNATTSLIPDSLMVNSNGALGDLVIDLKADADEYRMPTKDVVVLTSNNSPVEFDYVADYENGTATITVDRAIVDALTAPLYLNVSAEKYHNLTISSQGALYALTTSITGVTESVYNFTTETSDDTHLVYKASQDGKPVEGLQVVIYNSDTHAEYKTGTTNAEGVVSFDVSAGESYYPILKYNKVYKVIKRDAANIVLSTLPGQTLQDDAVKNGNATLEYDASVRKAKVTEVTSDTTVTFGVNENIDTIYFHTNEPTENTTTTAEFTSGGDTKQMAQDASVYGTLSTIQLEGYTFDGWYTAAEGGERIESTTPYVTGVNINLYAHWVANTNTKYTVKHWVEEVRGVNIDSTGETATGETKTVGNTRYYLYETTTHGATSDQTKDINDNILATMSDAKGVNTWWQKAGFVIEADAKDNCKVTADGKAIFNVYYDRKDVVLHFTNKGEGTATPSPDEVLNDLHVKFGARIGRMPEPSLEGYHFTYWYVADEDNTPVVPNKTLVSSDVCSFIEDTNLVAGWSANSATDWVIKVMTQDLEKDPNGVAKAADTYTQWKTVYIDDEVLGLQGTTDTTLTIDIDRISSLEIEGFSYTGYSDTDDPVNKTAQDANFQIYIKPAGDGEVYLYYDRDTVKVSAIDGDSNSNDMGRLVYGGDFTGHLPEDPVQDGHQFMYWADANDGTGKRVDSTTSANNYVVEGREVVLYPVWNARTYALTYVAGKNIGNYSNTTFTPSTGNSGDYTLSPTVNGGYVDGSLVTYGQKIGNMPVASRPGYNFVGWFLDGNEGTTEKAYVPDGATEVDEDTVVGVDNVVIPNDEHTLEETKVLYAGYAPHNYTFMLMPGEDDNGNAATCPTSTVPFVFNEKVSGLPIPTLSGYTFVGWSLKRNEMIRVDNDDLWTSAYTDGASIPLYAHYIAKQYKYSFNMNDKKGSTRGSLVDLSVIYGDQTYDKAMGEDAALGVVATRPGYNFKGWVAADDPDVVLTEDTIVDVSEDVVLFAKWEPKTYNVKLALKGATIADLKDNWNVDKGLYHPEASYDAETDTWTVPVKFDSVILNEQGYNPTGTLPVGTKDKAIYYGYKYETSNFADLDAKKDEHGFVKEMPAYTDYLDEDGITLTIVMEPYFVFTNNDPDASWVDDSLDVKDDGTLTDLRSDVTKIPELEKDGYKFVGWATQDNIDKIASDKEAGTLENLKNYVFTLEDFQNCDESQPFYPVFSALITLDAGEGATVEGFATQAEIIAGVDLPLTIKGVKPQYTFLKWQYTDGKDADIATVIANNVPVMIKAIYTPNIIIGPGTDTSDDPHPDNPSMDHTNITFDGSGVEIVGADGTKITVALDNLRDFPTLGNYKGWKFLGWFVGDKHITLAELKNFTEPTTVKAKWERIMASITLTEIGGHGSTIIKKEYPTYEDVVLTPELSDDLHFVRTLTVTGNVSKESNVLTPNDKGEYVFEMPEGGVAVEVIYVPLVGKYLDTVDHSKRLVAGYPNKTFKPTADITRAEFAQIVYNAIYKDIKEFVTPKTFKDVTNENVWYYKAVTTLGGMGIISGYPDGAFGPDNKISRAEAVTMLVNLLDKREFEITKSFDDIKGTEWYGKHVLTAASLGWVSGYGNGKFGPNNKITRAEAVTILTRMMERNADKAYVNAHLSDVSPYKDVRGDEWYGIYVIEATCPHDYQKTYDGTEIWVRNWWIDDVEEAHESLQKLFFRPLDK